MDRRNFIALAATNVFLTNILAAQISSCTSSHGRFYWLNLDNGLASTEVDQLDIGQPGSLMKLVASAAIVQESFPSKSKTVDCRGLALVNGQQYACRYAHGPVSLIEALGQSCNVFFANAAKEITIDCFIHYLKQFHLGNCFMANKDPKLNSSVELILGISPALLFSAVDILQLIALIAKTGEIGSIHLTLNGQDQRTIAGVNLTAHTWNVLQTGMHIACQRGTAKNLDRQNKLHIAAKTGTTEHGNKFQSWVAGYFPYEAPRYAFCLRANVGTSYDNAVPWAHHHLFSRDWL